MRLTETQLRRMIREEAAKSLDKKQSRKYSLRSLFEAGQTDIETNPTAASTSPKVPEMDATKVDWNSNYEKFVEALKSNAGDVKVKAFIAAGQLDQDDNDDKFSFGDAELDVSELVPTQNEIDVDKSLAYPMKDANKFLEYVKGTGQTFVLGSPIVTYNGKYVIDGHHRWSQLYACNKAAKIKAIDIQIAGLKPLDVLKAVQAAIAVQTGNVPVQSVKGTNLLGINKGGLEAWLAEKAKPEFLATCAADEEAMSIMMAEAPPRAAKAAEGTDKTLTVLNDYIWSNVEVMKAKSKPVSGAPSRDFMPQTDNIDWQAPLAAGVVDINQPHVQPPAKTESRRLNNGAVIVERWQKLAGLLK